MGTNQKRPVVNLELCLAGISKNVQVNLVNRTGYDYQLLLGRSFLSGNFVVDPSAVDYVRDGCKQE